MSKRKYNSTNRSENDLAKFITFTVGMLMIFLYFNFQTNREKFWEMFLMAGSAIFLLIVSIIVFYVLKGKMRKKHFSELIKKAQDNGLEPVIMNFINRFGMEGNKKKGWGFRGYFFDWARISDIERQINEKVKIKTSGKNKDVFILLRHYIQEKEENLTRESIKTETRSLSKLSGTDFEKLLHRLFTARGYATQLIGKTGDQGGDLIANKNGNRYLIQAKCYKDWGTGNSAVQQVVGALKYYDCNKAIVISTSYFTREAYALAKANKTILISKKRLQEMLLQSLGESWS